MSNMYNALTPLRRNLVDIMLVYLKEGTGPWKQGWGMAGAPESGVTGAKYRGINSFYLGMAAAENKYTDPRWVTVNQMKKNGWKFKVNEKGETLAKGKGVSIEFFEHIDTRTGKPLDKSILMDMTEDEIREFIQKNVRTCLKYYTVFNANLIENMPERQVKSLQEIDDEMENLISYWSNNVVKIDETGTESYYNIKEDKIYIPERTLFNNSQEFYSTALHEIAHSTGHKTRMDRDMGGGMKREEYAMEELRAEIASLFLMQEFGVYAKESLIKNSLAYIGAWKDRIISEPQALLNAIMDADKISSYIVNKYYEEAKCEWYALVEEENGIDMYVPDNKGGIIKINSEKLENQSDVENVIAGIKEREYFSHIPFRKVDMFTLKEKAKEITDPIASKAFIFTQDNKEGKEIKLDNLNDQRVLEIAYRSRFGEKFKALFEGNRVNETKEQDELELLKRLSIYCHTNRNQIKRIFMSSKQFDSNKNYDKQISQAIKEVNDLRIKNDLESRKKIAMRQTYGQEQN